MSPSHIFQDNPSNYQILTTEEAIKYLTSVGLSINDYSNILIPSGLVTVYILPNGEVLLLESGLRERYSAFVFKDEEVFKMYSRADYFPVPKTEMTWLVAHATQVQNFLVDADFYLRPLNDTLKLQRHLSTLNDCEEAFLKVSAYVRRKRISFEEREKISYCFGLAIIKFCIAEKHMLWEMKKYYEVYNPYYVPLLIIEEDRHNIYINVFDTVFRIMNANKKLSFRFFYWQLTGIPEDFIIN